MSDIDDWAAKLDPRSRLQVEDGLPASGVDVTVRLTRNDSQAEQQVQQAGLQVHATIGNIVVGHVSNEIDLGHIAGLPCVEEVQLAQPLYGDDRG